MLKINSCHLFFLAVLFFNNSNPLDCSLNSQPTIIKLIDNELHKYYERYKFSNYLNNKGIGKFAEYCEENGFDDDNIKAELGGDANFEESVFIDFDTAENFPGSTSTQKKEKKKHIFKILKFIYNYKEISICDNKICFNKKQEEKRKLNMLFFGFLRNEETKLKILLPADIQMYIMDWYNLGCTPCLHVEKILFKRFLGFEYKKVAMEDPEVIEILKEYDILNVKDENGKTVLLNALEKGRIETAELLLHKVANINIKESQARNGFILALYMNLPPYVLDVYKVVSTHKVLNKHREKKKKSTKTYPCPTCNKTLACRRSLNYHLKTHDPNRPRPYQCDICSKSFTQKSILKMHHRIHTSERPYRSHICHKGISSKASLRNHLNQHRGY